MFLWVTNQALKILLVSSVLRQRSSFVTSSGEWSGSVMWEGNTISNKINFLSLCLNARAPAMYSKASPLLLKRTSCYGHKRQTHVAAERRPLFQITLKPNLSALGQSRMQIPVVSPRPGKRPYLLFVGSFTPASDFCLPLRSWFYDMNKYAVKRWRKTQHVSCSHALTQRVFQCIFDFSLCLWSFQSISWPCKRNGRLVVQERFVPRVRHGTWCCLFAMQW